MDNYFGDHPLNSFYIGRGNDRKMLDILHNGNKVHNDWIRMIEQLTVDRNGISLTYPASDGIMTHREFPCRFDGINMSDIDLLTGLKSIQIGSYDGRLYAHKWSENLESIRIEHATNSYEVLDAIDRFPELKRLTARIICGIKGKGRPYSLPQQLKEKLIHLDANFICEWDALDGFSALESLTLFSGNVMTILPPLTDMPVLPSLKSLCLDRYSYTTLDGIENLPVVEVLNINNGMVSDLSALSGRKSIRELYACNNNLYDLAPLSDMDIGKLFIGSNMVEDLSPLANCKIKCLDIGGNPIDSIEPLAGHDNLEFLGLRGLPIKDLSPLYGCKNLRSLILDIETLPDKSQLEKLSFVPYINNQPFLVIWEKCFSGIKAEKPVASSGFF